MFARDGGRRVRGDTFLPLTMGGLRFFGLCPGRRARKLFCITLDKNMIVFIYLILFGVPIFCERKGSSLILVMGKLSPNGGHLISVSHLNSVSPIIPNMVVSVPQSLLGATNYFLPVSEGHLPVPPTHWGPQSDGGH